MYAPFPYLYGLNSSKAHNLIKLRNGEDGANKEEIYTWVQIQGNISNPKKPFKIVFFFSLRVLFKQSNKQTSGLA